MKVLRHLITGEPLLTAPARTARPNAFEGGEQSEPCPFCAGNEALTPAASATVMRGGKWLARAFPNKYPAAPNHEVVVESPAHAASFDDVPDPDAVVHLYVDRYRALSEATGVEYVSLFKNHGSMAGASIAHAHSQVLAVPFSPPRIERESAAFSSAATCPLCLAAKTHQDAGLVIAETETFVWLAPSSAVMSYEQWLLPKRHQHEMATLDDHERHDLAALLQDASRVMGKVAPACNWLFMNFPRRERSHFYIDLFPRLTPVAGFELATATFIETIDPAHTAQRFRERSS